LFFGLIEPFSFSILVDVFRADYRGSVVSDRGFRIFFSKIGGFRLLIEKPGLSLMKVCSFYMSLVWLKGTRETHSYFLKEVFIKKLFGSRVDVEGNKPIFIYLPGESLIDPSNLDMLLFLEISLDKSVLVLPI
jgi:hypothetical protein